MLHRQFVRDVIDNLESIEVDIDNTKNQLSIVPPEQEQLLVYKLVLLRELRTICQQHFLLLLEYDFWFSNPDLQSIQLCLQPNWMQESIPPVRAVGARYKDRELTKEELSNLRSISTCFQRYLPSHKEIIRTREGISLESLQEENQYIENQLAKVRRGEYKWSTGSSTGAGQESSKEVWR